LSSGAAHQGVVALAAAQRYAELDSLLPKARMLVLLDGVEDPHNLGAIVRTAHAAGADAVLIPERRSAGLTESVAKAAAGALEYLPLVRIGNVNQTIDLLKKSDFWIYGLDERGDQPYDAVEFTERVALIVGSEGKGLHEHVRKRCDILVRIPLVGRISSLNVSVATGVLLFEWKRRCIVKSGPEPRQ
jgi:23S rRNA (guanosine2251-2'-O)-methyltransferase